MEFTRKLSDITVPEHKLGVFECAVSDVNAQVEWYFNGQRVDQMQTKKRFRMLSIGEFRRLNVRDCLLHENDSTVKCKWEHLETSGQLMLIDCPFIISDGLKNQKVQKLSNVVMECRITNNLAPTEITFKWKKNGTPIDLEANKEKYEYVVEGELHRLTVNQFLKADEADYEIYLVDPEDYDVSSKAKISIVLGLGEMEEEIEDTTVSNEVIEAEEEFEEYEKKSKPKPKEEEKPVEEPKFVYVLNDQHVIRKKTATFELAVPTPLIKVRWMKDGKPLLTSSKVEMLVCVLYVQFKRLINHSNQIFPILSARKNE